MSATKHSASKLGFALEYSLGHTTHAQNLKRTLQSRPDIRPTYIDLPFHGMPGAWAKLPGIRSNWSIRASLGAYLGLRSQVKTLQAVLFHTQVTSLFSAGLMRRIPSVISLDATPLQYDALGRFYGHSPSANPQLEALKKRLNVTALTAARHLVTWSHWTKASLMADYGMPADKITVIPPGIDTAQWGFPRDLAHRSERLHLLFVGGDFKRKGGDVLLEAFRRLPTFVNATLHLVTNSPDVTADQPNIHVYRNVAPNSERLLSLFQQADIFVFPTRADCLPLAIMEALAAGLPIITTCVGALPEAVISGETGLVVPPDDPNALADAIRLLAADPDLRAQLGSQAREMALECFDATTNYLRLLDVVKSVVP
ncbi:MAG: glycosyl transferase group 1 [Chthonomonadaceae bacterium]|nr:glycosyl transferase group 1 [Chthonomonadaceae bacterium]